MPNVSSFARVPKYRRHKSSGQAVVTIGGRDHYLGKYNSAASQEAYRRLTAEYMLTGAPQAQSDLTVVEVLAQYNRFAKSYYVKNGKPTNERKMIQHVIGVVKPLYGRTTAIDFGPKALKTVRQAMIDKGWSRMHINKQVDRLKRIFKWAVSEELLPSRVYEALRTVTGLRKGRTVAKESKPVPPVADDVLQATLDELSSVVHDMVQVQRWTGARPSEICDLRPCDVNRSGDVWEYIPASHKTEHHERPRVIFIGPRAQRVLLPYLLRASEACCFSPAEAEAARRAEQHEARTTPMSCGNRPGTNRKQKPKRSAGEKYTAMTYGRAIRRACERAKVKVWAPNRLRHTFATEVRKTHGLEAVQCCLGHAKASVTEIYAERDFALAARVAADVG